MLSFKVYKIYYAIIFFISEFSLSFIMTKNRVLFQRSSIKMSSSSSSLLGKNEFELKSEFISNMTEMYNPSPYNNVKHHESIYKLSVNKTDSNDIRVKVKENITESILLGINKDSPRSTITFDSDEGGGVFMSFNFSTAASQHDILLGKFPPSHSKLICLSRIKRWWMAPFFANSADGVPIETQMVLSELDHNKLLNIDLASLFSPSSSSSSSSSSSTSHNPGKIYTIILPLIDYKNGFRMTLFGGNEGGSPAGNGVLASRAESGDPSVLTSHIKDAVFIAAGSDPYKLLSYAFSRVSSRMGTFRTRVSKPSIPGADNFGYCTWDAFYSSVDSDKVQTALESLRTIGAPPRFVIIDDGWQSTANMKDKRVKDPEKILDGELSGAQIGGELAAEKLLQKPIDSEESNMLSQACHQVISFATKLVTQFYTDIVEKAPPDDWSVKLWTFVSKTIIKEILIDFFASQTDFSKRLTSWKANLKFEDSRTGKSLKNFVSTLKSEFGIEKVFVWHALSGYWGGISDEQTDDFPIEFARDTEMGNENSLIGEILLKEKSNRFTISSRSSSSSVKEVYSTPTPHLLMIEPSLAWDPSSLSGCGTVALEKLPTMYRLMHNYLSDAGIDGVKVDAQSGIGTFGSGFGGGSALTRAAVQAVETSVKSAFGGKLISQIQRFQKRSTRFLDKFVDRLVPASEQQQQQQHPTHDYDTVVGEEDSVPLFACMCHSTENLLAYYETSSARASDDFYPKDKASQTVHLVSCGYNSVMLSEIVTPDWDMFHSQHEYAEMHAAARAISGGPIYVSDSPGRHNPEILRRLVMPNGKVFRCAFPARPTVDCLFNNVMEDGLSALKLFSRNVGGAGVVGAFNVQGSHWSRKDRKYVSSMIKSPFVVTQIKPSDCGLDFINDKYLPEFLDSFIAYSSSTKSLVVTNSPDSPIEIFLPQKGWEIITYQRLIKIDLKNEIEIVQETPELRLLKEEIKKLQSENKMYRKELEKIRNHTQTPTKTQIMDQEAANQLTSFIDNFDAISSIPVISDFKNISETSLLSYGSGSGSSSENNPSSSSSPLSYRSSPYSSGKKRLFFRSFKKSIVPIVTTLGFSIVNRKEIGLFTKIAGTVLGFITGLIAANRSYLPQGVSEKIKSVSWAPIGLLDIFNPGGSVTYIEPVTSKTNTASFYALGEGRFGIFTSNQPSKVLIDGKLIPTIFDKNTGLLEFVLEPIVKSPGVKNWDATKAFVRVNEERKIEIIWGD